MATDDVARSMENSTISLRRVLAGEPITLYIIIPPEKLHSHRALLRLWVGVLLNTILKRQFQPEHRTLFILEEAAQLGTFPPLLTATTLMRAYGLQLITVWQNLAQLKSRYPDDWTTILDNCEVIMSFGLGHYGSACELGAYCGFDPARLLELRPDEAAVSIRHHKPQFIRRMNYLRDAMFRGMFDPESHLSEISVIRAAATLLARRVHADGLCGVGISLHFGTPSFRNGVFSFFPVKGSLASPQYRSGRQRVSGTRTTHCQCPIIL